MQTDTDTQTETTTPETNVIDVEVEVLPPSDFRIETVANGETADLGFTITTDGVELAADQTIDQYRRGLDFFKKLDSKRKVWFSAYISKGRAKFGIERVEACLSQLEFDMPTVQVALDIATVPEELRHPGLASEHFLVLARAKDLTAPQRAKWARVASEQKLSANQLKQSIANGEVVTTATARQQRSGIISVHGLRQEFEIWMRRIDGVNGMLRMKLEEQDEVLNELKIIADFYTDLKARRGTKPPKAEKKIKAAKPKKAVKKPAAKKKPAKKKK